MLGRTIRNRMIPSLRSGVQRETALLGIGGRIGQAEADYTLFVGRNAHNLTDELDCVNAGDNF